ncbi:hypothetical protein ACIA8R_29910 [Nonomuraea sp. NPDC051191]|uniref:hypothetical protein n=1 Tax=Nonomuraea sp. NPDC051191 TaxID=3364372 RepID=UPI0037BD19DA
MSRLTARQVADRAIAAYLGTLTAVGITPPNVRAAQYAGNIRLLRIGEQAANNAAYRLADGNARTAAVTAVAVWGEFVHLWEHNASLRDLHTLAEALADVNDRAAWTTAAATA